MLILSFKFRSMRYLFIVVAFFFFSETLAQKVKYKDLFILLNAKRYEEAEPFLKKFIEEDDKVKDPNALMQMGHIYKEKSVNADVLTNSNIVSANADSAMMFYKKALVHIDDKEIRKNDEYYQDYIRRDIRTGKVEISLSDIHFQLNKWVESLESRKNLASSLKMNYDRFSRLYGDAASRYKQIKEKYPNQKLLLLRGDDDLIKDLAYIKEKYDSSRQIYFTYRGILDESKADFGYNQVWEEEYLEDYASSSPDVDFLQNDIEAYNLSQWAENVSETLDKDIQPLKKHILEYDEALDELYGKLAEDSASVKSEITSLTQKLLTRQLEKYDPNPLPVQLFRLKLAELNYRSSVMEIENPDSLNVFERISMVENLSNALGTIDSIIVILNGMNIEEESKNYQKFVMEKYGSHQKVSGLVSNKKDFVKNERARLTQMLDQLNTRLTYTVYAQDTIPLFDSLSTKLPFKPLYTEPEKYSYGFTVTDTTISGGYFVDVNPGRVSQMKAEIILNNEVFSLEDLPQVSSLSVTDDDEEIFYVIIMKDEEIDSLGYQTDLLVSKIYKQTGLSWTRHFEWQGARPNEAFYQPDTGNLVLSYADRPEKIIVTKEGEIEK